MVAGAGSVSGAPAVPAARFFLWRCCSPLLDGHHSIKPNRELYSAKIMPLIVHQPTLQHYVDLLEQTNFLTWTYNTILVAVVTTVVSLVLGAMIAYPLARLNFPGAAVSPSGSPRPISRASAAAVHPDVGRDQQARPEQHAVGGDGDIPDPADPVLRVAAEGYFKSVPRELEEAARIDGASRFQAMLPRGPAALHSRPALGGDLRLHAGAERVPVRADLPDQKRRAHGAGGGDHELIRGDVFLLGPAQWPPPCWAPYPSRLIYSFFVDYYGGRPHAGSVKN